MEIDIYEQPTTYLNDYRFPILSQRPKAGYYSEKDEPIRKARHLATIKDMESLHHYRCQAKLPFNLFHIPKEIVKTNPNDIIDFPQDICPIPSKVPQTVQSVSPAVSFEEAVDLLGPGTKELLIKYTYSTTYNKANEDTNIQVIHREIPNSTLERYANPMRFGDSISLPLPLGWKQAANKWDELQARCLGDPRKNFWEQHAPRIRINTMTDWKAGIVPEKTLRKVDELAHQDRLRHPHDLMQPKWTGYRPKFPLSVPLEKSDP